MRTASLRLALSCALLAAAACTPGSGGSDAAPGPQAATVVCGDRDADGRFETADIQDCVDAAPPGPVVIQLLPGLTYEPPASAAEFTNAFGFVELPSETTLDCQGSRLRGIDAQRKVAPSAWGGLIVVTNSDHTSDTQHDIWVRDCEIDAGMPASYDEDANPFDTDTYIGFALYGVTRGGLTDSFVHDTHHACVYVRNSKDVLVENNRVENCGGANNLGSQSQPAIYVYQSGTTTTERITVRNNHAVHAGSSLYNTRVEDANAEYQTAWLRDVVFEGNYGEQLGNGAPCISLRGVREARASDNTCVRTGGILLSDRTLGFCSQNPPVVFSGFWESGCVQDALLERNLLIDSELGGLPAAITVFDYHEDVRLVDNTVVGTHQAFPTSAKACFAWQAPVHGLVVDGLDASACEGSGIEQLPDDTLAPPSPDSAVQFSRIDVQGAQWFGMFVRGHDAALDVDELTIAGSRFDPVRIQGPLADGALRRFTLDGASTTSGSGLRVDAQVNLLLEAGTVRNVVGAGVHFAGGGPLQVSITNLLCEQPLLGAGVAQPMDYCVLNASGPGAFSLSSVQCGAGAGNAACVSGL